jgi:hypothetical protein
MKTYIYYTLEQSPFYKLESKAKLNKILGITMDLLNYFRSSTVKYHEFKIKINKYGFDILPEKQRLIEASNPALKQCQKRISDLLCRIQPPNYLYNPVKGRSSISNAAQHKDSRVVRCLDIKKYFPSSKDVRVYWFFNKVMKCSDDIAAILTKIATYNGHLPTGSPLSPIMSYFAHYDMWENIAALCAAENCILTVYMDDITISGVKVSEKLTSDIKKAISHVGLKHHKTKENHYIDKPATVTGVIIDKGKLKVPYDKMKKLMSLVNDIKSTTLTKAERLKLNSQILGYKSHFAEIKKAA